MDDAPTVLDTSPSSPLLPNGTHNIQPDASKPVPVVNGVDHQNEDPTTPISNIVASEPKIEVDMSEQQLNGDSQEPVSPVQLINGTNGSLKMEEIEDHSTPGDPPPPSSNSTSHPSPADDDDQPPPAKRPRILSDADQASFANSATPPPPSAESKPPLDLPQWRFCISTIRSLKKLKDSPPFLHPVDPVALQIPHYPTIVRNPMDLMTIERKLVSSNPAKPDPNPENPRYLTTDDFVADVRLIVKNCILFNGPEHPITAMVRRVEEVFDKQIKNMPLPVEAKPIPVKKPTPPPAAPTALPQKKAQPPRQIAGRPKREVHPPPPKDLSYADGPKKVRKTRHVKDDGTSEQLKFCGSMLTLLHRKQYFPFAVHFYEPVDHIKLDLPAYPKIVKKPMDLSTMRKKLDEGEYLNAQKFHDDFKLMIRNCFAFNPSGTPVHQAGIEVQRVFDEKWQNLPPLHDISEDEDEDDETEDEDAQRIAMMESQIEAMRGNIQALKSKPKKEKKKHESRDRAASSSSKPSKPPKTSSSSSNKKKSKKVVTENDVLTFEQKKDLSEAIAQLDGPKLERVIKIIHEGVPEIKDSTEEIELEIDLLPTSVLTKLYNFVLRPLRAPPTTKRSRPGKGTGTGGLKRKSMDEDVEAEKIRMLETRMALFEQPGNGAVPAGGGGHSSDDSSSGSDSSGSDSE
ncbi:Bromodomain-containing protein [Mycena indigotica]|uniref:Bromodomain-containing protein n=1 Tax=Mycena indigotica TaxID=2126181 RepID=A0A8H6SV22_9AGAR|nr:Bromodomain-containing protein [Mycena indigotica]KAF7306710.1 Bromodomain-containing protein [Mycena indigotica]